MMTDRKPERRGLGRGLSALMADVAASAQGSNADNRVRDTVLPIEKLVPNPEQPRSHFDPDQLAELAASIRQKGIIQPLIVRPFGDVYQIIAGERRWRAAQRAQIHEVPVVIRTMSDTEVLEVAIIENIQRADLNPVEEAMGYRALIDQFGHTQEKLAEAMGKSRSHIANLMRLLTLPEDVLSMVRDGQLTAGHARALVTIAEPQKLARKIVAEGLSVRQVEALVKQPEQPVSPKSNRSATHKDADLRALENDLGAVIGMPVEIADSGKGSGKLTITYRSMDDMDKLCRILGGPVS